jgi:rhodanese-related sulfurtransferase
MAARMAAKSGYTNIKVYHAGIPDWVKNGNVLLSTFDFVSKRIAFLILIDTRGPEAAEKGHIQGAVAIPLSEVVKQKNQFPLDKKAYIVLYSDNTNIAGLSPVVKEIIKWGFERVYVLDGGYLGWTKKNGLTQSGMVRTEIFYLPRPHPGEITGDEFVNIVRNLPEDKLILDVRTQAETSMGMIKGAKNIPVDELQSRLKELPKDKEIIVHCRTGLRAEMGYTILRNGAFKTRFLNDKVAIVEDQLYCCYKD